MDNRSPTLFGSVRGVFEKQKAEMSHVLASLRFTPNITATARTRGLQLCLVAFVGKPRTGGGGAVGYTLTVPLVLVQQRLSSADGFCFIFGTIVQRQCISGGDGSR